MPPREFANQKALVAYAEQNGLAYLWEGMPAFAKRQRLLSRDQYERASGLAGSPLARPQQFQDHADHRARAF